MSENVNVPVDGGDKEAVKAQEASKDAPKPAPKGEVKVKSRKQAEVKEAKPVDQTVRGGQYIKAAGRHYVVVDAHGKTVDDLMVVEDEKTGTLEIVEA